MRLAYVAELPPPAELARLLAGSEDQPAAPAPPLPPAPAPTAGPLALAPAPAAEPELLEEPEPDLATPRSFAEAVELFERFGEPMLHGWLYQAARVVRFEPGRIELQPRGGHPGRALRPDRGGARALDRPALAGQHRTGATAAPRRALPSRPKPEKRARIDALSDDPRVKPILESFPGARIVDVRSAAD